MLTLFYACAGAGVAIVVLQFLLGLVGVAHDGEVQLAHDGHDLHDAHVEDGLNLFSVRSLSAGLAFFGIGGAGAMAAGLGVPLSFAVGAGLGAGATVAVAAALRSFRRLEDDGTVQVEGAIGLPAQVYVPIPAGRGGVGKVLMTLQNRTVELQAVTADAEPIATGTGVTVVDVLGADTVEVSRVFELLPEIPA